MGGGSFAILELHARGGLGQILAERDRTVDARRVTDAVNQFLPGDLLRQADPEHNPVGDKVTVVDLLDRASQRLEDNRDLQAHPDVAATLHMNIGMTYKGLARLKEGSSTPPRTSIARA